MLTGETPRSSSRRYVRLYILIYIHVYICTCMYNIYRICMHTDKYNLMLLCKASYY